MKYILILYAILIIYFIFHTYKKRKEEKERSIHLANVKQQMKEDKSDAVDRILRDCYSELDALMEYPNFLSFDSRFEYLKGGGISPTDAYDYVVNQGWTPKKYAYILLMQMILSDISTLSGTITSSRKKYYYLNDKLYEDGLISYDEMEQNEVNFMKAVKRRLR